MASDSEIFFNGYFQALTHCQPYPWQCKLFQKFIATQNAAPDLLTPQANELRDCTATPVSRDSWPEVVDLPTGAGKTSVLYVWALALAWSIQTKSFNVPRRLAWIVNRRVVVDQITTEIEELIDRIEGHRDASIPSQCPELRDLLASVSLTGQSLLATTLRGQRADNGDWCRDPSTPAVIVGTVDMIGSRLLFRGYRAGPYHRPIHAGCLGVDTLVVNDEAHLSPALASLLTSIRDWNPSGGIEGKSFRVLLLSATPGTSTGLKRFQHHPAEDADESAAFSRVFHAPKKLVLLSIENAKAQESAFWNLATESPAPRTAIFIEQPEKAVQFLERLKKGKLPCALLTGTMRGYERDCLMANPEFRRFLDREPGLEPVWLVATSAAEVGINFSCERMITGLAEADHLLQRFGRLNRFGDTIPGEAFVVYRPLGEPPKDNEPASDKESRLRATLAYLKSLEGGISCANIWDHRPPMEACTEPPQFARLESRHIDIWSQTTYRDRFVPPVASWLHGKKESEAPETEVAWRSDVNFLTSWDIGAEQIGKILEYYSVQTHERLSEPTSRVVKKLAEIKQQMGVAAAGESKVIVVESDGSVSVHDLASLVDQAEQQETFLENTLLLLPDGLGSLVQGMFRAAPPNLGDESMDVADKTGSASPRVRLLFDGDQANRVPAEAETDGLPPPPGSVERAALAAFAVDYGFRPALVINHPDDEDKVLVYFGAVSSFKRNKPVDVPLAVHQTNVAQTASDLIAYLNLRGFSEVFCTAGSNHDNGKHRPVWQHAMGGSMLTPIAKTKAPVNLKLINGYRHELGSLVDATSEDANPDDLLLHLIASHHAGARPYFDANQYDRQNLRKSAVQSLEAARRYARLQSKYGPWGLAYLEAVFKCADGMVSASEGEPASE